MALGAALSLSVVVVVAEGASAGGILIIYTHKSAFFFLRSSRVENFRVPGHEIMGRCVFLLYLYTHVYVYVYYIIYIECILNEFYSEEGQRCIYRLN